MKKIIVILLVILLVGCAGPLIYTGVQEEIIEKVHEPEAVTGTFVDGEDFILRTEIHEGGYRSYYVTEEVYRSKDIGDELFANEVLFGDYNNYNL